MKLVSKMSLLALLTYFFCVNPPSSTQAQLRSLLNNLSENRRLVENDTNSGCPNAKAANNQDDRSENKLMQLTDIFAESPDLEGRKGGEALSSDGESDSDEIEEPPKNLQLRNFKNLFSELGGPLKERIVEMIDSALERYGRVVESIREEAKDIILSLALAFVVVTPQEYKRRKCVVHDGSFTAFYKNINVESITFMTSMAILFFLEDLESYRNLILELF